jgi:hypothetical protein
MIRPQCATAQAIDDIIKLCERCVQCIRLHCVYAIHSRGDCSGADCVRAAAAIAAAIAVHVAMCVAQHYAANSYQAGHCVCMHSIYKHAQC